MSDTQAAPTFVLGAFPINFTWTVRIPVPVADSYRVLEQQLIFRSFDQIEIDRMRGIGLGPDEVQPTARQIAEKVIVGWPAMRDVHGNEVPFRAEALNQFLSEPICCRAAVATYLAAMEGMAAGKNG